MRYFNHIVDTPKIITSGGLALVDLPIPIHHKFILILSRREVESAPKVLFLGYLVNSGVQVMALLPVVEGTLEEDLILDWTLPKRYLLIVLPIKGGCEWGAVILFVAFIAACDTFFHYFAKNITQKMNRLQNLFRKTLVDKYIEFQSNESEPATFINNLSQEI